MAISISPELEAQVRGKAEAERVSVQYYIERLIREDEEWSELAEAPLSENDLEFREIRQAVEEGLEQAERGEGRPAEEVVAGLRARNGIPR